MRSNRRSARRLRSVATEPPLTPAAGSYLNLPSTASPGATMALTVLFMPESAYGPTNNCVGIGDILRRRGHRVVFAAEASWKGKLTPLGFEEDLVDIAPSPQDGAEQDAGQFWKDFIRDTAPEFRKPTIDQLETWIKPVWIEL